MTKQLPYLTSVYDLLDLRPERSADLLAEIREWESEHGLEVPPAVRELFAVPAAWNAWEAHIGSHFLARQDQFLDRFAAAAANERNYFTSPPDGLSPMVDIVHENQSIVVWYVEVDGSDDPPIWEWWSSEMDIASGWQRGARTFAEGWPVIVPDVARFSELVFTWIWTAAHTERVWLRSCSTLHPAALEQLTESFGDSEHRTLWDGIARYTFFEPDDGGGGFVRVTTDHEGGESMWWLEAGCVDRLARIARPLVDSGLLARDSLRR